MITPKVTQKSVMFGPCRLCYVNVFEKAKFEGESEEQSKYQCHILIPKKEKETVKAIEAAIEAAKEEGIASKWGRKLPKNYRAPLQDGDQRDDEVYAGHWYINAKSKNKPYVVDRAKNIITDPEEMYSGVWAVASVGFYAYATGGGNGVGAALNGLLKWKDDEHLGGSGNPAKAELDALELPEDDDEV